REHLYTVRRSIAFQRGSHDGILETMDDRKKIALLKLLTAFCAQTKVQSIFSVIQAEMPEDSDGKPVAFTDIQIIRELSDVGVNGRLFRMAPSSLRLVFATLFRPGEAVRGDGGRLLQIAAHHPDHGQIDLL
ncbi:MAG TPA: DUF2326 domain-containing protein, partial [Burkholderiales bacterium]|nr:DUF2326 domain-containing protein [Burkholderiales bacterium]